MEVCIVKKSVSGVTALIVVSFAALEISVAPPLDSAARAGKEFKHGLLQIKI